MAESVRITGLKETVRSLERFGVNAADLKAAFTRIGQIVIKDAKPRTPTLTGALVASLRASKTKNKSEVRAGTARVDYAVYQHYGFRSNPGTPYLWDAVEAKRPEAVEMIEDDLNKLIAQYGLK